MKRKIISYVLATSFWLIALLFGWLMGQRKEVHWGMFILWAVSITYFYIILIKEFKNRI
jgi:hypothetical protein